MASRSAGEEWGGCVYDLRGILVAPPILAAAVCGWNEYHNGLIVWPLGVALFLAGWAVRIWAQRHVAYRLRVRKVITTCGPYAYVRNPIYLGNILMGLGAVVASKVLWMLPVTLLWYLAVYSAAVRHEERRLVSRYGAGYLAYRAAVCRWLPRWSGSCGTACRHGNVGGVLMSELHAPLILAPAMLKALHVLVPAAEVLRRLRAG